MSEKESKSLLLCYLSPGGGTGKAAGKIAESLEPHGYEATEFDLRGFGTGAAGPVPRGELEQCDLLAVGSPVYADHVLSPVMEFISGLPRVEGTPAIVFVAFGGVSKGSSLYQMAAALSSKGYRVIGAAKVLSRHTMMFRSEEPVGAGHPDTADFEVLEAWVDSISGRLEPGSVGRLDLEKIKPGAAERLMDATFVNMKTMYWVHPRKRFRPDLCTGCGACAGRCASGRLRMEEGLSRVVIDRDVPCLNCYECVRVCPEGAFDAPMWMSHPVVKQFHRRAVRRGADGTRTYE